MACIHIARRWCVLPRADSVPQQLDSSGTAIGMSLGRTAVVLAKQTGAQGIGCITDTGNAAIRVCLVARAAGHVALGLFT